MTSLLRIFFAVIVDPTQFNRQGPDSRPAISQRLVPIGPEQDRVARAYLSRLRRRACGAAGS
jgi:peptide-methionine (S)-S-oxide reductase